MRKPRPSPDEIAEARAAGVPWKAIEAATGYCRGRLWEILNDCGPRRVAADKDVVTTSEGLTHSWGRQIAFATDKGE